MVFRNVSPRRLPGMTVRMHASTMTARTLRHALLAFCVATLAGCTAAKQREPADVSAAEVATYKGGLEKGCRDDARGRKETPAQVDTFCSCVIVTLNQRMSQDEWRKATFFAQQHNDRAEQEVLAPHMSAMANCRAPPGKRP